MHARKNISAEQLHARSRITPGGAILGDNIEDDDRRTHAAPTIRQARHQDIPGEHIALSSFPQYHGHIELMPFCLRVTVFAGRLPHFFRVIQSELGWSGLYRMIISVFGAPSCRSERVVWQLMQNRASTF